ncbi:hypothetical protein EDC01DRAFT_776375 [Geopyxis carbonaria]|nr:hypothetical protein EDC01DRAFT_776375 [Geopyxis carbonaria]
MRLASLFLLLLVRFMSVLVSPQEFPAAARVTKKKRKRAHGCVGPGRAGGLQKRLTDTAYGLGGGGLDTGCAAAAAAKVAKGRKVEKRLVAITSNIAVVAAVEADKEMGGRSGPCYAICGGFSVFGARRR